MKQAPGWLRNTLACSAKWAGIDWSRGSDAEAMDDDGRKSVEDLEQAEAVSSVDMWNIEDPEQGRHTVMLDLDCPAALIPSSTPGHWHLYIARQLTWRDYAKLLTVLGEVGILEPGFVNASLKRKQTFLRMPWVRKGAERKTVSKLDLKALVAWLDEPVDPRSR